MNKINKRNTLDKISKELLMIASIFILFVIIGAYLNKIYPSAQSYITSNISGAVEYYNSSISFKNTLISNFKVDMLFLGGIAISTMTIVLLPISIIIFILKALAIGYTINSLILALKISSIKIILITLAKGIIIIPSILILGILSVKYVCEIVDEIKRKNKGKIVFLVRRYFLNSTVIIILAASVQLVFNAISIATLQILF
ncbi:MAG: stage II sporulation protein M [Paraclostridium sp.]